MRLGRTIAVPLVASVVLHALLVVALSLAPPPELPTPAPAVRSLVEIAVVAEPPPRPASLDPAPPRLAVPGPRAREPVRARRSVPVAAPATSELKPADSAPAVATAQTPEPVEVSTTSNGGVVVPAAASATGAGIESAAASASAGAGDGSGGLPSGSGSGSGEGAGSADAWAQLAARLADAARGCYPKAAARFHAEGVAKVRFCVDADGQPEKVELVESSGVPMLDDAATGCVLARAAPLPRVNDCAALPVRFALGR